MRKVTVLNRISLDGFFAGPNGEIDWFIPDSEVDKAAHEIIHSDTLLLGRVTYQMFVGYWPAVGTDPHAPPEARRTAEELNQMNKVVFSRTLEEVTWENTELVKRDVTDRVQGLKQGNGPDITIFGSGTVIQQLTKAGLIDEYLLIVSPTILGKGKPLFEGVSPVSLKLVEARNYKSGNVLLHYSTDKK